MGNRKLNRTDKISILIILISDLIIIFILWKFAPGTEIYIIISLVGSIASTSGLIIAIIQILELRKTAEATQTAIISTEKELSVLRTIESASNCFNQLNQIDEYLETNNFNSIKTLLPIATKNFHDMVFFEAFNLEEIMQEKNSMRDFLESFASTLTISTNHKNVKKIEYQLEDKNQQ